MTGISRFPPARAFAPGAGFAMAEAVLILARLLADWQVHADPARVPIPQAHMTVRAHDGIWLQFQRRELHSNM